MTNTDDNRMHVFPKKSGLIHHKEDQQFCTQVGGEGGLAYIGMVIGLRRSCTAHLR